MLMLKDMETTSTDDVPKSNSSCFKNPKAVLDQSQGNLIVADYRSVGFMHQEFNISLLNYLSLQLSGSGLHFLGNPGYTHDLQKLFPNFHIDVCDDDILTRNQFKGLELLEIFFRSAIAVKRTLRIAATKKMQNAYIF